MTESRDGPQQAAAERRAEELDVDSWLNCNSVAVHHDGQVEAGQVAESAHVLLAAFSLLACDALEVPKHSAPKVHKLIRKF